MSAKPRVPISSYAQLKARREYYRRNRLALILRQKLYRAEVPITTAQARAEVGS